MLAGCIDDHFPDVLNVNASTIIFCKASVELKLIKDVRIHIVTQRLEVLIKRDVDTTTILADESFHLNFLNEPDVHHVSKMDSSSISYINWTKRHDSLILQIGAVHG